MLNDPILTKVAKKMHS